uniref:EGF-like domain-containing protein n=1 Tax=Soboliphyme baturini TaxID=241478 RepID=A0A183ISW5_9BILA
LPGGKYCPAGCVCDDTVIRCSGKKLKEFPQGLPMDITELYLDNNEIEIIPPQVLNKIDLSNNKIMVLENDTFFNLSQLSTLILSYNKLQCLEATAFHGLKSLRILSLHGNDLSTLPKLAFQDLTSLTHIALGSNSLYCDCMMHWFADLIKKNYIESGIARCSGPKSLRNQLILTTPTHDFVCLAKCDACVLNPCENNGRCVPLPRRNFKCVCVPGFHGDTCHDVVDACYGDPCLNGATCKILEKGRFSCYCIKGFEGDRCETNIDDCIGNQCQNNATCLDLINDYKCTCPPGYTGIKLIDYCSKSLNPCENGATCVAEKHSYRCLCAPGYSGVNCTEDNNDCLNNLCKNGATCKDGINGYSCLCSPGFSGIYCEMPSMDNALYPKTSPCHHHDCRNGFCFQPDNAVDYRCQCIPGYGGEKCDKLYSVTFENFDNYVILRPLVMRPTVNITFTIMTEQSRGVVLYYGDDAHLAVELFERRVKISYYVGNYPASIMYSFTEVNDGSPHKIQLLSTGKNLTMTIDHWKPSTILNNGMIDYMDVPMDTPLYVGGLPKNYYSASCFVVLYSLMMLFSLGCIKDLYINSKIYDFQTSESPLKIVPGCAAFEDPCRKNKCTENGECKPVLSSLSYVCECHSGYKGQYCDERIKKCVKKRYREHLSENGCVSKKPIKNAKCDGYCGINCTCRASKMRSRKIGLICADKSKKYKTVNIIRKCSCSDEL